MKIELEVVKAKKQQVKSQDKNNIPALITKYEFIANGKLENGDSIKGKFYASSYLLNVGEKIYLEYIGENNENKEIS